MMMMGELFEKHLALKRMRDQEGAGRIGEILDFALVPLLGFFLLISFFSFFFYLPDVSSEHSQPQPCVNTRVFDPDGPHISFLQTDPPFPG